MIDLHDSIADRPSDLPDVERVRQLELQATQDLQLLGPGPAAFFQDACRLMHTHAHDFATTTHLAAHLLREVNSATIDLLAVIEDVPKKVEARARKQVQAACRFLQIGTDDAIAVAWMELSTSSKNGLHRLAHRVNLSTPRPVDGEFISQFQRSVETLASIAALIKQRYLRLHDLVDSLIQRETPPKDLASCIPRAPLVLAHLFGNLRHSSWIAPLRRAGFFDLPEDHTGVQDLEDHRFSPWPQGQFLARMASEQDRTVQTLILEIMLPCNESQAPFVHTVLTSAALAMPAGLATQWAARERHYISRQYTLDGNLAIMLGRLVSYLAQNGKPDDALSLASALLDILPNPDLDRTRKPDGENDILDLLSNKSRMRISNYEYDEILEKNIPDLVAVAPDETFALLSALVEKAMTLGLRDPAKSNHYDLSSIHRPTIEDHPQNRDYQLGHQLISTWRDVAETIINQHPDRLDALVTEVEVREWNLFRRLALHLLRVSTQPSAALLEARLTDPKLYVDSGIHHEFWNLLHDRFGLLSAPAKERVLGIIAKGRGLSDFGDMTSDRREAYRRHDEYRWLLAIESHLEGAGSHRLQTLRKEFGAPSMPPDFLAWAGGGAIEPKSPLKYDDIATMPVDSLVEWLKNWKPSGKWEEPTPSALGAQLSALVQSAPEKWASDLRHFQDAELDPTYQRHLVAGFSALQEKGTPFPWATVLSFCQWLVDLPVTITGRVVPEGMTHGLDTDRDRRPLRIEIARLIGKAFHTKDVADPPFELREPFWAVIEPLTSDPDPTAEDEGEGVVDLASDPLNLSLNRVRGIALRDALHYALWVCRQLKGGVAYQDRSPGLADMPKVQVVLNRRLDAEAGFGWSVNDRAVLGELLPQLVHIAPEWVRSHLGELFPASPNLRRQRTAVWDAYICYSRLYTNVYEVLRDQYMQAVTALPGEPGEADGANPKTRLAEHIMLLYMWGAAGLKAEDIVATFFRTADSALAGKALRFAGEILETKEQIPDDVIERFRKLWKWRVKSVGGIDKMPDPELGAFCLWFVSGRFDMPWLLQYLPTAVRVKDMRWVEDRILQRLLAHFETYPVEALDCLRKMVDRTQDSWVFMPSQDKPVWQILDKGLAHTDASVRDEADAITHLLGAKGHLGYRELLQHRERVMPCNPETP